MRSCEASFRRISGEVVVEFRRLWKVRINGNHIGIPNRDSSKEFLCVFRLCELRFGCDIWRDGEEGVTFFCCCIYTDV